MHLVSFQHLSPSYLQCALSNQCTMNWVQFSMDHKKEHTYLSTVRSKQKDQSDIAVFSPEISDEKRLDTKRWQPYLASLSITHAHERQSKSYRRKEEKAIKIDSDLAPKQSPSCVPFDWSKKCALTDAWKTQYTIERRTLIEWICVLPSFFLACPHAKRYLLDRWALEKIHLPRVQCVPQLTGLINIPWVLLRCQVSHGPYCTAHWGSQR